MNQALDASSNNDGLCEQFRVMVVDDDLDLAESLRDVLEMEDATLDVKVVTNAADAIALANEFRPDIALLDIKLGRTNGLDLVPRLKRSLPDTFCVMMTAFRDSEYAVTAVKFGADDYLHKPVDPEKLLQTFDRFKQQKIIRDEKRAAERRFRAVFNQTFQMLYIIAADGTLIDINNVAVKFMQSEKRDLVGMHLSKLPCFSDQNDLVERLSAALHKAVSGSTERMQCSFVSEFEHLEFDCSMKPVLDDFGILDYVVLEARDVTPLKEAEREVRRINRELEQRVLDRTVELDLARRKAEHASEAKSRFLSRMSHELRTPMNAILGFTQLLMSDNEPELIDHQRDYVDELMKAGGHLLSLIDDILDLTRLESGTLHFDLTTVNFGEVLDDAVRMIKDSADEKRISLSYPRKAADFSVNAEPLRLKKVLVNLLDNAVKFNRRGGAIAVSIDEAGEGIHRISIADTGCGISEDDISRVFAPFETVADNYYSDGVGVGLSMVKTLVEQMGGEVGVNSKEGEGATVWFTLRECRDNTVVPVEDKSSNKVIPLLLKPKKKLLLVGKDEASHRAVQELIRRRKDIELLWASNSQEGLALARASKPDLILLDADLPDVKAYQLMAILNGEIDLSQVPVIVIADDKAKRDADLVKQAGFMASLTWPLNAEAFWTAVDACLIAN